MDNKYVGDGYPLCKDLPTRHFLKKGATFRLLGSKPEPELLNDPEEWWGAPVRISLEESSALASKLCKNTGDDEECVPSIRVVLDSDIECHGVECTLQELRSFEVGEGSGIWFEYIRPACVNHAFYNGAQSVRRRWGQTGNAMCGDPGTLAAVTACCNGTNIAKDWPSREEVFSGERVSLDLAQQRCSSSASTLSLCENPFVRDSDCNRNGGCDNLGTFYWSSLGCSLTAKINQEGKVAVVHNPEIEGVDTYKMVTDDTEMYFRVDWISDDADSIAHQLVGDCLRFGCTNGDRTTCICPTSVNETPAFVHEEDFLSLENVLSIATIGSFLHTQENFQPVDGMEGLSKYPHGDLTAETIFKIVDSNGQAHFRQNKQNEVHLGTGTAKFRNPVTFYTLSEPTIRDATYETDATLGHAFYHRNMAPFLALKLAQRFGESNPSPSYIKSISTAFRSGVYAHPSTGIWFGSGQYGCLEATIAAVLLDEEIVDPILDADPAQ